MMPNRYSGTRSSPCSCSNASSTRSMKAPEKQESSMTATRRRSVPGAARRILRQLLAGDHPLPRRDRRETQRKGRHQALLGCLERVNPASLVLGRTQPAATRLSLRKSRQSPKKIYPIVATCDATTTSERYLLTLSCISNTSDFATVNDGRPLKAESEFFQRSAGIAARFRAPSVASITVSLKSPPSSTYNSIKLVDLMTASRSAAVRRPYRV